MKSTKKTDRKTASSKVKQVKPIEVVSAANVVNSTNSSNVGNAANAANVGNAVNIVKKLSSSAAGVKSNAKPAGRVVSKPRRRISFAQTEINVIKPLALFACSFIFVFGFYIQLHGKVSPGGGFQSGIVVAMIFIIRDGLGIISGNINEDQVRYFASKITAVLGVLIYASMGIIPMFFNATAFNYSTLSIFGISGRTIGIFGIETGVGFGVLGSMLLIYSSFREFVFLDKSNIKHKIKH